MAYLILSLLLSAVVYFSAKQGRETLALLVVSIALATFAALRSDTVDPDFSVYESWYGMDHDVEGFYERSFIFEALFFLVSDIFSALKLPFRVFIWAIAFASITIKLVCIKHVSSTAKGLALGTLFYFLSYFLLHELVQIRVGVAVAFSMLAYLNLLKENYRRFTFFTLAALLFHMSAVLSLLALLLYSNRTRRLANLVLALLLFLGICISLSSYSVLNSFSGLAERIDPRLDLYVQIALSGLKEPANPFPVTSFFLLGTCCFAYIELIRGSRPVGSEKSLSSMLFFSRLIFISLLPLLFFSEVQEVALRIAEFFSAVVPLYVALLFSRSGFVASKLMMCLWLGAILYIYLFRSPPLLLPYSIYSR